MEFYQIYLIYLQRFGREYEKSLEGFEPEEKLDITDHLLALIKCFRQQEPDYDKIRELNEALYKKYRKRLTNYDSIKVSEYFSEQSTKYSDLQFELKIEGAGHKETYFTPDQQQRFLKEAESILMNAKRFMYLLSDEPEQETSEDLKVKTRGRIKRERDDGITRLNQEQTALLIYCLRKTRVIMQEDYLSNKEAGQAFSLLTGYSADTLRQNLSKSELIRMATKKNVEVVEKTLKDLQKFVEDEIEPEY